MSETVQIMVGPRGKQMLVSVIEYYAAANCAGCDKQIGLSDCDTAIAASNGALAAGWRHVEGVGNLCPACLQERGATVRESTATQRDYDALAKAHDMVVKAAQAVLQKRAFDERLDDALGDLDLAIVSATSVLMAREESKLFDPAPEPAIIEITVDGVAAKRLPAGVIVEIHDYTAPDDWGSFEQDDDGNAYQRLVFQAEGEVQS